MELMMDKRIGIIGINMLLPRSFSSRISSINVACISGSSPLVGSSRISISGPCIKAQTISIFCFIPFGNDANVPSPAR
jgi:hypothetical protein